MDESILYSRRPKSASTEALVSSQRTSTEIGVDCGHERSNICLTHPDGEKRMFRKGKKDQIPSVASTEAVRIHIRSFFKNFSAASTGVFGFIWILLEVAIFFELPVGPLKQLQIDGYVILALLSIIIGGAVALTRTASALRREWLKIEIQLKPPPGEDSSERLSSELVDTVRRLHALEEHAEVVMLGSALSRPLWLSGRYDQRAAIGAFYEDSAARIHRCEQQIGALIDDLGWTNVVRGEIATAKRNINHGIEIAGRHKLFYLAAKGHRHLGTLALRYEKDLAESDRQFELAKQTCVDISDEHERDEMLAGIVFNQCEVALDRQDYADARKLAEQLTSLYSKLNDKARLVKVKGLIARIDMRSGQLNDAKDGFREALEEARTMGRRDEIGKSLLGLGETHLMEGNRDLANNTLEDAIKVFEELNSAKELAKAKDLYRITTEGDVYIPTD